MTFPMLPGKDTFAIDLSGNYLKIVHAKVSTIRHQIVDLYDHEIKNISDNDISALISEYFTKRNIKNPVVFCVIPNRITMTKNIEVPSRNIKEVEEIINLQVGRHTPFAKEEIISDYVKIGVYKQTYTKILLIIVNRSVVTRQLEIFKNAKIKVEKMVFCPEAFAVTYTTFLKMNAENSPIVLAHIDDDHTDFIVVSKNKVLFVRSMPIGAEHFLEDKERSGIKFIEQVRLSMETYHGEDIETVPTKLFLIGATEGLQGLEEKLNAELHVPAKEVPYYDHLSIEAEVKRLLVEKTSQISYLNVITAILAEDKIQVNLLPEEIKFKHKLEQRVRQILKAGIHVITIMVILCSLIVAKIYFKSIYINQLDQKLRVIAPKVEQIEKSMTEIRSIKDYLINQGHIINVLAEIYEIVPKNTYFSDIKISETNDFSIKGFSDSMSSVFTFIGIMEESPYFGDVVAKYTSKRKEGENDVAIFEVAGKVIKKADQCK
ncbi:MAG: pilus assembly protein PilM [Candidatus Omnitrophica bacterium]|nr:pilus assembly protein PilM [Candidatus Omnitrophota bacterium]